MLAVKKYTMGLIRLARYVRLHQLDQRENFNMLKFRMLLLKYRLCFVLERRYCDDIYTRPALFNRLNELGFNFTPLF